MPEIDINNPDKTEREEELETDLAKMKNSLEAVTSELISTRKDKADLTEKLKTVPEIHFPQDVTTQISDALRKENEKKAEINRQRAWEDFTRSHPEFHKDNDTGGLRKAIFDEKLSGFKNENLLEREDFLARFDDVLKVLTQKTETQTSTPGSASTPSVPGSPRATQSQAVKFSEPDMQFILGMGLDPEKVAARIKKARGL